MVLHKSIVVRESAIAGKGLFAIGRIDVGELVWQGEDNEEELYWHTVEEISKMSKELQTQFYSRAYRVKEGVWSGVLDDQETDGSEYMNHSCVPACWFVNDDACRMVACKVIEVGEEITYDYGTSEIGRAFTCLCGAVTCRSSVSGEDYKDRAFVEKYRDHCTQFFIETREKWLASSAAAAAAAAAGAEESESTSAS
eukprot:TRINITY_DN610_c0_g2_i1.p1 TRINITY_DN610_c0_g2~~TRINITY_DN610_c0_g2_i1.p1  ORF type:complete len:197 (-),score=43.54 TRINITY_DN610_c0_g2_i1:2-592(-)